MRVGRWATMTRIMAARVTWNTIMYFTVCVCTLALTRSFTMEFDRCWSSGRNDAGALALSALELSITAIGVIVAVRARLRQLGWPWWLVAPVVVFSFGSTIYLTVSSGAGGGRIAAVPYLLPHVPLLFGKKRVGRNGSA